LLRRISIQLSFQITLLSFFCAFAKSDIALITNQEANTVDVIDLKKREKISEIFVGKKPAGIFIDKSTKTFFTSNPGSNNISMFKLNSSKHNFLNSGKSPMSIQLDHKKNLLFVSNWFENQISIIDINKNKILSKINVGKSPAGIYLSNNSQLFIAVKGENIVTVVDIASQKKIKDIMVGKAPYGIFSNKNTNFLFVTNVQSNSVTVIDKISLSVRANINVGSWPYQIAFEKKKKILFVTNQRDNSISIINLKKFDVTKTLEDVCEYPEGIDISYNENLIVVACWFEDNIILLDLDSYKLIKKIKVSGGPRSFGNFILENYE
jgi:YVTN family beta-propeller protein